MLGFFSKLYFQIYVDTIYYSREKKVKKISIFPLLSDAFLLLTQKEREPYLAISFCDEGLSVDNKYCQKNTSTFSIT